MPDGCAAAGAKVRYFRLPDGSLLRQRDRIAGERVPDMEGKGRGTDSGGADEREALEAGYVCGQAAAAGVPRDWKGPEGQEELRKENEEVMTVRRDQRGDGGLVASRHVSTTLSEGTRADESLKATSGCGNGGGWGPQEDRRVVRNSLGTGRLEGEGLRAVPAPTPRAVPCTSPFAATQDELAPGGNLGDGTGVTSGGGGRDSWGWKAVPPSPLPHAETGLCAAMSLSASSVSSSGRRGQGAQEVGTGCGEQPVRAAGRHSGATAAAPRSTGSAVLQAEVSAALSKCKGHWRLRC